LSDDYRFKRFRPNNKTTPISTSGNTAVEWSEQSSDKTLWSWVQPANDVSLVISPGLQQVLELTFNEPAPWGSFAVNLNLSLINIATVPLILRSRTRVYRWQANSVTYAREEVITDAQFDYVNVILNGGAVSNVAPITASIQTKWDPRELSRVTVELDHNLAVNVAMFIDVSASSFWVTSNENSVREQRASGVATAYQSLTQVQLSVSGKSTYETVPNAILSRNLPIGYNVEVPGVAEIARDSYIHQLGNPLRCVYSGSEYYKVTVGLIHAQSAQDIAMRASTFSRKLFNALDAAAPYLIGAASGVSTVLTGNPMVGKAVGAIGSGIYQGIHGIGRNQVMNNSTVMRSSTKNPTMNLQDVSANSNPVAWEARINEAKSVYGTRVTEFHVKGESPKRILRGERYDIINPNLGLMGSDPLLNARLECFRTENCFGMAKAFREGEIFYTRFPSILGSNVHMCCIVASLKPLRDILGGGTDYLDINGFQVDQRLASSFVNSLTNSNLSLNDQTRESKCYITAVFGGVIPGLVAGTSHELATFALFNGLGPKFLYTGSSSEELDEEDLIAKYGGAMMVGSRMIVASLTKLEELRGLEGAMPLTKASMRAASSDLIYLDGVSFGFWGFIAGYVVMMLALGTKNTGVAMTEKKKMSMAGTMKEIDPSGELTLKSRIYDSGTLNEMLRARKQGRYGEYITRLGPHGDGWWNRLLKNYKNGNADAINSALRQADDNIESADRGGSKKKKTGQKAISKVKLVEKARATARSGAPRNIRSILEQEMEKSDDEEDYE
jgi:hypothetical protein